MVVEPPLAARHPRALPAVPALQVGVEDRELPRALHRLEHEPERLRASSGAATARASSQMMQDCDRCSREGNSIMMFPEGTRSPTGRLRAFKPGAFELALRNRRPILPIVIEGTADALPKRGFVLRGRHPLADPRARPDPVRELRRPGRRASSPTACASDPRRARSASRARRRPRGEPALAELARLRPDPPRKELPCATCSSSKPSGRPSAAGAAASRACTRRISSAPCSRRASSAPGIDAARGRPGDRRLRVAGGRAVVQRRAHRVALGGAAPRGGRDDRRQPVRLEPAGVDPRAGLVGVGPRGRRALLRRRVA